MCEREYKKRGVSENEGTATIDEGDIGTLNVGDLLRDWRRINVAITRAKKKMIIIGSAATMGHVPLLSELVAMMRRKAVN